MAAAALTPAENPTTICVFCGSSSGTSPSHLSAARNLASVFAKRNIHLVYGGGTVGLMGELARTLVSLSGPDSVHGVIPSALIPLEAKRRELNGVVFDEPVVILPNGDSVMNMPDPKVFGKTTVVSDMHTRKRLMADFVVNGGPGSGFIALSGGYGTLEELMEVVTWNQLGIHERGVCVYNVEGYWDGILGWVRNAVGAGFVQEGNKMILVEGRDAEECVRQLREYKKAEGRFKLSWGDEGKRK